MWSREWWDEWHRKEKVNKKKWKEFKENIGDTEKKSDGEIKDKMKERNESKC